MAQAHLEQGIALYNPQQHRSHAFQYGQDPGIACWSYAAWTLWFLGYPDQALRQCHEALTLACAFAHPFSLAFALQFAAVLHQLRRDIQDTQEQAEALMTLSTEHGFPLRLAQGRSLRGWALAMQGQGAAGVTQMQQGLAAWEATGAEVGRPHMRVLLAEAYMLVEQPETGLAVLADTLTSVQQTGVRVYEAELHRLKGALLLLHARAAQVEAEDCFLQALEVARCQQAKSLELRAAMSLARLWQQQGKGAAAYELLIPICSWFTEGFDTMDLQEAKALLAALEGEHRRG
jgi:predicted ATPase